MTRRWNTMWLLTLLTLGALAPSAWAQADAPAKDEKKSDAPPALEEYKGRKIAQTMHWMGAPWLLRETREDEEKASVMLRELGIKPGDVVCDMGCGNGYHALRLAKMVGPEGKVYGVDIQKQMLALLKTNAKKAGVENVVPVLGELHDPNLPEASCDLILLVDVYHEFSHPVHMLAAMRKALKPNGRVALVEFRAEDPNVPIKPLHKMSKAQIMKEWPANGFKLVREFDDLPWQHLMFFARDDAPEEDDKPEKDSK